MRNNQLETVQSDPKLLELLSRASDQSMILHKTWDLITLRALTLIAIKPPPTDTTAALSQMPCGYLAVPVAAEAPLAMDESRVAQTALVTSSRSSQRSTQPASLKQSRPLHRQAGAAGQISAPHHCIFYPLFSSSHPTTSRCDSRMQMLCTQSAGHNVASHSRKQSRAAANTMETSQSRRPAQPIEQASVEAARCG